MHLRWLRVMLVLSVVTLQCIVGPVGASLPEMDRGQFLERIKSESESNMLILLYQEGVKESEVGEEVIETMIQEGDIQQLLPGIEVMKQKEGGPFSESLRITTFPALVLIRDGITAYYTGGMSESSEVYMWLDRAGVKAVTQELNDATFEHLTQASTGSTTGHWLVLFYRSDCIDHFTVLESVGISEKMWMNVARVNLDNNPKLEKRFKTTTCPELIYFREGKMYHYETPKYDVPSLTSFVTSWFRNVKASPVPLSPTAFDELTEGIALYIKRQLEGENRTLTLVVVVGVTVMMVLTTLFCCLTGGSDAKQKTE